jgi:hypothetical protein
MVKINPSPCVACKYKDDPCSRGDCEKFSAWVKESWPVVVRGMRRLRWRGRVPAHACKEQANCGRKARPVIASNESGEVINYKSVPFAASQLHIATSMIYNAINGKVETAGGYKWRYADAK